jgi:hypothetical protein
LTEIQILAHVAKEITQQKQSYELSCARGSAKDFAEYRNLCGVIQGLGIAIEHINDLVRKLERDDD